ncbi:MAG: dockerin type I domain-containing protein [Ruminococcus sp.]
MKKVISVLAAGVMALSSLSVLGVSAEETYALGDVDMDGIVTGHDTAMVSRYVLDDTYTLTEEQLQLADVNGDGEVNQADADILYNDMQEYVLGNAVMRKKDTFHYDSETGEEIECKKSILSVEDAVFVMTHYVRTCANLENDWTQVQENLADVNLDGVIDMADVNCILDMYVRVTVRLTRFENPNQYYASTIEDRFGWE